MTQLTNDNITAGHDVGAHYLPDGRIVFASTRQLGDPVHPARRGPAAVPGADRRSHQQSIFLLHVMNADGSDMHQISFNTNHDFAPSVLANGQIVFSRWETENGARSACTAPIPTAPDSSSLRRQQSRHRRQPRRHE